MESEQIGERIEQAIELEGVDRATLARRAGRGKDWVTRRISGERKCSLRDVEEIAAALKVSAAWLAFGEGSARLGRDPATVELVAAYEADLRRRAGASGIPADNVARYLQAKPSRITVDQFMSESLRGVGLLRDSKGAQHRTTLYSNGSPAAWGEAAPREHHVAEPGLLPDTVFIRR